jgi:hypothetical protein
MIKGAMPVSQPTTCPAQWMSTLLRVNSAQYTTSTYVAAYTKILAGERVPQMLLNIDGTAGCGNSVEDEHTINSTQAYYHTKSPRWRPK